MISSSYAASIVKRLIHDIRGLSNPNQKNSVQWIDISTSLNFPSPVVLVNDG